MGSPVRLCAASFWLLAALASCDPGLSGLSSGAPPESTKGLEAGTGDGSTGNGADGSVDAAGTDGGGDSCDSADGGLRDNGTSCRQGTECCSGACSESHRCVAMCLSEGAGGCDPQASTCCTDTYCSVTAGTQCKPCIETGNTPEMVNGVVNEHSCCSRHASSGTSGGLVKCSSDNG